MGTRQRRFPDEDKPYFSNLSSDEREFDYEDVTVYTSDLASLEGTNWLTDNIIAFTSAFLKKEILHNYNGFEVEIFPPSIIEIIKFSSSYENMIAIDKNKFNIFPISDNNNPAIACSGSHWSLLLYDPRLCQFVFLDSMHTYPPPDIKKFSSKVAAIMRLENIDIVHPKCPKMMINGNCGMYLIEFINVIFHRMLAGMNDLYVFNEVNDDLLAQRRKFWLERAFDLCEG